MSVHVTNIRIYNIGNVKESACVVNEKLLTEHYFFVLELN